ncbi:MAG: hypothetical protein D6725_05680 [Planctomycetota bacterium]|nr:MAG: hypothetical protein D6725_05680 [Planctomycetota bacterium]
MYFQFACEHCGKGLKVREENIGRRVRCPYCRQSMTVRAPEDGAADEAPRPAPPTPPSAEQAASNAPAPGGASVSLPFEPSGSPAASSRTPSRSAAARHGRPRSRARTHRFEGTDVHPLQSALYGAALSVVFLVVLFPFRDWYLGELFYKRGWVPFALVFLMSWSAAILVLKWRKLSIQKETMLFDLLPTSIARDITPENIDAFVEHINGLPTEAADSFLVNRVLRGLEHFRVTRNSAEVAARMATQSDIDANAVASSYTILKVFIWAIPILGFIGTVIGISAAVGGFSGSMDAAQDIAVLKQSLNNVTSGLSTAFDTTLVALVMSMLVMFPTSSLQKAEEDLLNWVDEYCNENLLLRLRGDAQPQQADGNRLEQIERAIDAAMVPHHAELRKWTQQLESLGKTLTDHVAQGFDRLDGRLLRKYEQKLAEFQAATSKLLSEQRDLAGRIHESQQSIAQTAQQVAQDFSRLQERLGSLQQSIVDRIGDRIDQSLRSWEERHAELATRHAELATQLTTAAQQADTAFQQLTQTAQATRELLADSFPQSTSQLNGTLQSVSEVLVQLNTTLAQLAHSDAGQATARTEAGDGHPSPGRRTRRRGWGLFGRR